MKNMKRGKDEPNEKKQTSKTADNAQPDSADAQPDDGVYDTPEEGTVDIETDETVIEPESSSHEQRYNDLLDRYQRVLAEFDNFRKRTQKEKTTVYDDGLRDTVEKLLPVLDNFERALSAGEDKENKFFKGVEMIARQLNAVLTDIGVEQIPAEHGEIFNPNVHFAVAHLEDDQYDTNVVLDELQKGYRYKDKVIRPSMVRVAN